VEAPELTIEIVSAESGAPGPASPFATQSRWLTDYNWFEIVLGIVLAGCAYPIVVAAAGIALSIIASIWSAVFGLGGPAAVEIVSMGFGIAVFSLFAAAVGFAWSGFVTLITAPIVYLFVRSLRVRAPIVGFGAAWGGLVGFVAVLPIAALIAWNSSRTGALGALLMTLAAGPGLATVLGQLGGAWGGWRAVLQRQFDDRLAASFAAGQGASLRPSEPGWESAAGNGNVNPAPDMAELEQANDMTPWFQFQIRHLLWITVWTSLLLTVIRLCQIPFEFAMPMLVGWLAFQSLTLYAGWRIQKWWSGRRRRNRLANASLECHCEPPVVLAEPGSTGELRDDSPLHVKQSAG
jgi:hypothetical protein